MHAMLLYKVIRRYSSVEELGCYQLPCFRRASFHSVRQFQNTSSSLRFHPVSRTQSNPFLPMSALLEKRSTLAFSIRRAIMAVGNCDSMSARCRNSVAGASAPWPDG